LSTSDASVAIGGMSDKDKEHARIMARLDELEMEEREAGSASEEEDDGVAGTSEDGEENEESGNVLNDRSHGNIQLKSALKKPGGISHTPSAHTSHPITILKSGFVKLFLLKMTNM